MNMATCCEGDILNHVIPFISQHMEDPDWRKREAAIMAFGSILEGPPAEKLKQFIDQDRFHYPVENNLFESTQKTHLKTMKGHANNYHTIIR